MRDEQELRDGVLETLRCLISCCEKFPGMPMEQAFNEDALREVKEEYNYLKELLK